MSFVMLTSMIVECGYTRKADDSAVSNTIGLELSVGTAMRVEMTVEGYGGFEDLSARDVGGASGATYGLPFVMIDEHKALRILRYSKGTGTTRSRTM